MAKNDAVAYKDYLIYPMALYQAPSEKWQAMALITRDTSDQDLTLPRSQSFPQLPGLFNDEDSALTHAVHYGRLLIDGKEPGLSI